MVVSSHTTNTSYIHRMFDDPFPFFGSTLSLIQFLTVMIPEVSVDPTRRWFLLTQCDYSHLGQMSLTYFVYRTEIHCGTGLRMTSRDVRLHVQLCSEFTNSLHNYSCSASTR